MRILVLCDDYWHPAATARAGLGALAEQGFDFDWIEDARDWSAAAMDNYQVTVLTKANEYSAADRTPWVDPAVEIAFAEYVSAGHGLLVIHSGSAGYGERSVLRALMGGVFVRHPKQCPVTVEPRAGHTLTAGCDPFTLIDEHYFVTFEDAGADLFLTTSSEHGSKPAGWLRSEGAGRVCLLTPGHNLEVWLHPSYQKLIANALAWCGAR